MEYSVCLPAVFGGISIPDAIRRVSALGFGAYEFWSWWDQDVDAILEAQEATGLRPRGLCTRFVSLTAPGERDAYIAGLRKSLQIAKRLRCPTLISQVGQAIAGVPREEQHRSIVEGLKMCAPMLEDAGVTLAVEPLNTLVDHRGYYLERSDEAFEIIREVGSPNVRVLFDIYHQQITEGNLIANLTKNIDMIAHVHIAGNPGRHEPLIDSEVHYPTVIGALRSCGYDGAVGLEYFPLRDPEEGLRDILLRMSID